MKTKIKNPQAQEVKRMQCTQCKQFINKCDECGNGFKNNDHIECVHGGNWHYCQKCK